MVLVLKRNQLKSQLLSNQVHLLLKLVNLRIQVLEKLYRLVQVKHQMLKLCKLDQSKLKLVNSTKNQVLMKVLKVKKGLMNSMVLKTGKILRPKGKNRKAMTKAKVICLKLSSLKCHLVVTGSTMMKRQQLLNEC